jgi:hypothetical protein
MQLGACKITHNYASTHTTPHKLTHTDLCTQHGTLKLIVGRHCTQVFKDKASSRDDSSSHAVRAAYGDASGKLFDDRRRGEDSLKSRNEEVGACVCCVYG